jgi:hypothetical protein
MLPEPEDAPVEGARHVEAPVSSVEATVAVGDPDLGLGDERTVEVGDAGGRGAPPWDWLHRVFLQTGAAVNTHHTRVRGWTITPSHFLNNHLDTVWLAD